MKTIIFFFFTFLFGLNACNNISDNFWDSSEAYLGQTPPDETPKIFAKGLLAEDGCYVGGRVAFSKDGKEFFIVII